MTLQQKCTAVPRIRFWYVRFQGSSIACMRNQLRSCAGKGKARVDEFCIDLDKAIFQESENAI